MLRLYWKRSDQLVKAKTRASRNCSEVFQLWRPSTVDPVIDGPLSDIQLLSQCPLGDIVGFKPVDEQLPFGVVCHCRNIGHLHNLVNSLPIVISGKEVGNLVKLFLMTAERRNAMTRPFTSKSEKDAGLLRAAWKKADDERQAKGLPRLSRKALAKIYKVTPGTVSHYMRGREPLNVKWQMRFGGYLGISPSAIWEDFPHKDLAPGHLPPQAVELTLDLLDLDQNEFDAVRKLVQSLTKKRA